MAYILGLGQQSPIAVYKDFSRQDARANHHQEYVILKLLRKALVFVRKISEADMVYELISSSKIFREV